MQLIGSDVLFFFFAWAVILTPSSPGTYFPNIPDRREKGTLEGYLWKRGSLFRGWKERWFILDSVKHQVSQEMCRKRLTLSEPSVNYAGSGCFIYTRVTNAVEQARSHINARTHVRAHTFKHRHTQTHTQTHTHTHSHTFRQTLS